MTRILGYRCHYVTRRFGSDRVRCVNVSEVMRSGAYAALLEFERTARMIPNAPALADRTALADAAAGQLAAFRGAQAAPDTAPDATGVPDRGFAQLDATVARTEPRDWWEALATACLWPPLVREVLAGGRGPLDAPGGAAGVDPAGVDPAGVETAPLDTAWAEARLRAALEHDPTLADRLLLCGRRLVGEAIALAFAVGSRAPRDAAADGPGPDAQFAALAERLTEEHAVRLAAVLPVAPEPEDEPREGRPRPRR
jgi:tRNA-(MS[2]IO[6]A)-hydroxylase (MiaE)-like